jgi:poly(beta-D-mannuronate) lyase
VPASPTRRGLLRSFALGSAGLLLPVWPAPATAAHLAAAPRDLPGALRTRIVSGRPMLDMALASARPGDHIVLADGVYGGSPLPITARGTAQHPIVVRAANPVRLRPDGTVLVSGARIQTRLDVTGAHLWLYGLDCDGTGWLGNTFLIRLNDARNVKIKRCRIHHWEGRGIELKGASTDAEIAYNDLSPRSFDDQRPIYPRGPAAQVRNRHRNGIRGDASALRADIHHNHFHDYPAKGQPYDDYKVAALICGVSPATGGREAYWDVHHNLFARCHSSSEGVDAPFAEWKASRCTFRENTFDNCNGHLTFRQGLDNNLIANWFRDVRAVRFMDRGHRILGNVVEYTEASAQFPRTGLNVLAGTIPWTTPQAQKLGFPQAYQVVVAGNRRQGALGRFLTVGASISSSSVLPALDTRIEGWDPSMGPIAFGRHLGTQGPTRATRESWPTATPLSPAQVGPGADLA